MKFAIVGADRETGEDVEFSVEATDEAHARAKASAKGILVSNVRCSSNLRPATSSEPISSPTATAPHVSKPVWTTITPDEVRIGVTEVAARLLALDALFRVGSVRGLSEGVITGFYHHGGQCVTMNVRVSPAENGCSTVAVAYTGVATLGAAPAHASDAFFRTLKAIYGNVPRHTLPRAANIPLDTEPSVAFEQAIVALRSAGKADVVLPEKMVAFGRIDYLIYTVRIRISVAADRESSGQSWVSVETSPQDDSRTAITKIINRFIDAIRNPGSGRSQLRHRLSVAALILLAAGGLWTVLALTAPSRTQRSDDSPFSGGGSQAARRALPSISTTSVIGGGPATTVTFSNWHAVGTQLSATMTWTSGRVEGVFYTIKRNGVIADRGRVVIPGGVLQKDEPVEVKVYLPSLEFSGMEVVIEVAE